MSFSSNQAIRSAIIYAQTGKGISTTSAGVAFLFFQKYIADIVFFYIFDILEKWWKRQNETKIE